MGSPPPQHVFFFSWAAELTTLLPGRMLHANSLIQTTILCCVWIKIKPILFEQYSECDSRQNVSDMPLYAGKLCAQDFRETVEAKLGILASWSGTKKELSNVHLSHPLFYGT